MNSLLTYLTKSSSIAPLVVFRAIFGFMMLGGTIRFWLNGWIEEQYIKPLIHFPFWGFEWVKVLPPQEMYLLFALMGVSAFFIAIGLLYRIFTVVFFCTFSYIELIDKCNYLNHYYFISLVAFILIFLPANRSFSVDGILWKNIQTNRVPKWCIVVLQLQLGIVYFYAGLAKLNPDWLLEALPLKIWLPSKSNLPIIGFLMDKLWVAYFFSWFGAVYDLLIPFLLINNKTRNYAYIAVIVFHIATASLFQIGMFPYIMILATLIYFPASFHEKILSLAGRKIIYINRYYKPSFMPLLTVLFIAFFTFQLLFPFRFALYPGKLFWTEQGYRFSWRVMLMEKAGTAFFYVKDSKTGKEVEVSNCDYLTPYQEKMMSTQPDMLLQFAHILAADYAAKGFENPKVRVESYVSLNGKGSRPFVKPETILNEQTESWKHKDWIIEYK